jgi:hypothetical protein
MNQKLESPSESFLFLSLFISPQVQMMRREQTTKWSSNRWPEKEKPIFKGSETIIIGDIPLCFLHIYELSYPLWQTYII